MKTMKILFTGVALFAAITFCHAQPPVGYTITGNVTGFPDNTKFYLQNLSTDKIVDSALVVNNKFVLQGHLDEVPEQLWLHTTVNDEFIYANLLIGNDNINVEGDIADFPWHVKITGSKTQDESNELYNLTDEYMIARGTAYDDYVKLPNDIREEKGKEFLGKVAKLDSIRSAIEIEFVKSHLDTYIGVITLGYLKDKLPKDTMRMMFGQVPDEIRNSKYGKRIEIYLNSKVSEIGDICHDFEAFDKDGNTVRFHDLLDGKYILLDMTQANCGPCVLSINELKMVNVRYSDSLKVVSFYGDANKETWLNSLERDTPTWLGLWDGKGMNGETFIKYGVQGTPSFYLIDPQGKIIDIQVGFGPGVIVKQLGENNIPRNDAYTR